MASYIDIPRPCHEDWNKMLPEEHGRHCLQCCKTVINFTEWNVQDIAAYLQANAATKTCGRFTQNQLNIPIDEHEALVKQIWYSSLSFYKKIAAVIILFFGLASCNDSQVLGDIRIADTTKSKDISEIRTMGEIRRSDTSPQCPNPPIIAPIKFVPPHEQPLLGEPAIIDTAEVMNTPTIPDSTQFK